MFGALRNKLHRYSPGDEVTDRVAPINVTEAARVICLAVAKVIERHSLRQTGVQPSSGLIDSSYVTARRIGIADQELDARVLRQRSGYNAEDTGFSIAGQFVREP